MTTFKSIIAHSHAVVIKAALNRILYLEQDTIINTLLRAYISAPENADEKLVFTDKFHLYREMWKAVLETLYETYLPQKEYTFTWQIEITPYTLMLCELTGEGFESSELELQRKIMAFTDEELENDLPAFLEKAGFHNLGFSTDLANLIPANTLPASAKDRLILLMRLMNFPPLGELALFQHRFNEKIKKQVKKLSIALEHIKPEQIPSYGMPESLHLSYFHVTHDTFKTHGLDGFKANPLLSDYAGEFESIRHKALENKDRFKDEILCPCCGKKQEITIPEEVLQYKYLLENLVLCKKVGLVYLDEFIETYKKTMAERFLSFLPNLNKVDNPECLILVEGESEETSIPILGFRIRYILSHHKIQVYNSKSKEKLAADFLSFKANFPNRKIICLLDADAVKERDDIQRVIKDHQDKYRLVFIKKGTFEDLFDLDLAIDILNDIYPDGEAIIRADFNPDRDFLQNIGRILHLKKKATFDKVLFAKTISLKMDIEKLPDEINTFFAIAKDLVTPGKYIRK